MVFKIALVSHSSHRGGAESVFMNMVKTIAGLGHQVVAIFPDTKGPLPKILMNMGVATAVAPMSRMLGDPTSAALRLSGGSYGSMRDVLSKLNVDLVVSNTLSVFDGALAAAQLGKPHIWFVHEIIERSPEFKFPSIAKGSFAAWIQELSDHLIFCSVATRDAYLAADAVVKSTVVYPNQFDSTTTPARYQPTRSKEVLRIFVIGADNERKNLSHAVEVLKALRMRGNAAELFFVGLKHDRTSALDFLVRRRGVAEHVTYLGFVLDPYRYFSGMAVNLICAVCEPGATTVAESLVRGIPVVGPRIDGIAEVVDDAFTYPLNSVDDCVRVLEKAAADYVLAMEQAFASYERHRVKYDTTHQATAFGSAIGAAVQDKRVKVIPQEFDTLYFHNAILNTVVGEEALSISIASLLNKSVEALNADVTAERTNPGSMVINDLKKFNVVPFQPSPEMDLLYKKGEGFCIELLANMQDAARIKLASFILLRLLTQRRSKKNNLKILAIGDGIGIESIRMASAGFDVDYMDVDKSVMSSVAEANFVAFKRTSLDHFGEIEVVGPERLGLCAYDALICLEVIEHVSDPFSFVKFLSKQLKQDGLLFISDYFEGIQDKYSTHVASSERLAGLLPQMGIAANLHFEGHNKSMPFKPYIFKKSTTEVPCHMMAEMTSDHFIHAITSKRAKVGRPTLSGISYAMSQVRSFRYILSAAMHKLKN